MMNPARRDVTLVLGGGGAKGIVHIGVLRALEAEGLEVKAIVGTSIGAIWAALFAATRVQHYPDSQEHAVTAFEDLAIGLQLQEYLDIAWRGSGVIRGDKFESWLTTLLWNQKENRALFFNDLDFDLVITASDAQTGDPVVFWRGNRTSAGVPIAKAVRASMSIQGFFCEPTIDIPDEKGRVRSVRCWDGGSTGNCRFDLGLRYFPERPVIASSLTYRGEPIPIRRSLLRNRRWLNEVRDHTIDVLLRELEVALRDAMPEADKRLLLLHPPLSGIKTFDFRIDGATRARAVAAAIDYARNAIRRSREEKRF
jgi:NTE family protein